MNQFAQVGDYCPNESCIDYGKLQTEVATPNICKFGKTKNGTQRVAFQRLRDQIGDKIKGHFLAH